MAAPERRDRVIVPVEQIVKGVPGLSALVFGERFRLPDGSVKAASGWSTEDIYDPGAEGTREEALRNIWAAFTAELETQREAGRVLVDENPQPEENVHNGLMKFELKVWFVDVGVEDAATYGTLRDYAYGYYGE